MNYLHACKDIVHKRTQELATQIGLIIETYDKTDTIQKMAMDIHLSTVNEELKILINETKGILYYPDELFDMLCCEISKLDNGKDVISTLNEITSLEIPEKILTKYSFRNKQK